MLAWMETYTDGSQAKEPLYFNYEYLQEKNLRKTPTRWTANKDWGQAACERASRMERAHTPQSTPFT